MKEILTVHLNRARNAEHFQFHADVLDIVTADLAEARHIGQLRQSYASLFADEDEAFVRNRAYEATVEIEEKDRVRDDLFLYIKQTIESNLHCPLADRREAAGKLAFALNPYRSANAAPYAENTARITNFTGDMQGGEYAPLVETLGLTEAVRQLGTANEEFNAVYSGRSGEKLARVSGDSMKTVRRKVDEAYRAVAGAVNALYQANELVGHDKETAASLGGVIDGINALIVQLKQTLSLRGAAARGTVPDGGTETPESLPDAGEEPGNGDGTGETPSPTA